MLYLYTMCYSKYTDSLKEVMAKPTVMVRMYVETKEELDKVATDDRRSIQDALDILVQSAIARRKARASAKSVWHE